MIEQMKIGVSFVLTNDSAKLKTFLSTITKTEKSVTALNIKLARTSELLTKMDAVFTSLNPKMKEFSTIIADTTPNISALATATKGSSSAFTSLNRKLLNSVARMDNTRSAARHLTNALVDLEAVGGAAGLSLGGGKGTGGGGGGSGRRKGGRNEAHHLMRLGGLGAITGVSPGTAGVIGLGYLGYKGFEANMEYQRNVQQTALQNIPGANTASINSFVTSHRMFGVSDIQMAQMVTDALVITKDWGAAQGIAPTLAQMNFASKGLFGNYSNNELQSAIKVAEITSGSKDPARLRPMLEHMFKVQTGSGMRVKPSTFLSMVAGARGALTGVGGMFKTGTGADSFLSGIDPDFAFYTMEPVAQEVGGARAGRMLGQAMIHLVGSRLSTASAMDFQELGLVKPGTAQFDKVGRIKRIKPKGIVGSDELAKTKNLFKWVQQYYIPALQKRGITQWPDIYQHVLTDFTNTDSQLVAMFIGQMDKIQQNVQANKAAAGLSQTTAAVQQMPGGQTQGVAAAWSNLTKDFGNLTAPAMGEALQKLTAILNFLDKIVLGANFITDLINNRDKNNTPEMTNKGLGFLLGNVLGAPDDTRVVDNSTTPVAIARPKSTHMEATFVVGGDALAKCLIPYLGEQVYRASIQEQSSFNYLRSPPVQSMTNISR